MKIESLFLSDKQIITSEGKKAYPVLRAGIFYSKKYNGVWDRDLKVFENNRGPGKVDVHLNYLEGIVENFKSGALETIPYVDIEHEEGVSMADISDVFIKDNTLFVIPEWNKPGTEKVKNGEYHYFSVYVDSHVDSTSGKLSFPVLHTTSLTNNPVIKGQEAITLSDTEPTGSKNGTGNGKQNPENKQPKEAKTMFGELIKQLLDAIKTAFADPAQKDEVTKVTGDLVKQIQGITGASTAAAASDKTQLSNKDIMDSPIFKELTVQLSNLKMTSEDANAQLAEMKFREKYVGKKITAVEMGDKEKGFFSLYLSNPKAVESILDARPDLNLTNEQGSGNKKSGTSVTLSENDKEIMKDSGLDPNKPEDVTTYKNIHGGI